MTGSTVALAKDVVELLWGALGLYFLAGILTSKRPRQPEAAGTRAVRWAGGGLITLLLLWEGPPLGFLRIRNFRSGTPLLMAGLLLTAGGLLLTAASRFYLGRFWSASVVVKDAHRLIQGGPYARIRHPLYTGLLTAIAGTELIYAQWRFVFIFIAALALFSAKARAEERLLGTEFGAEYEYYRKHSGFFFPRIM